MKFYEQKEPYCLIKAKDEEDMRMVFAQEIDGYILEDPDLFNLQEISKNDAYKTFSRATDEDGNSVGKAEIDEVFNSDISEVLSVSRELI